MAFYDANADGQISIKEFARTLGHDPRAFHVKDAFRVADSNGRILLFDLSCKSLTKIKTWVLMYIFLFFFQAMDWWMPMNSKTMPGSLMTTLMMTVIVVNEK